MNRLAMNWHLVGNLFKVEGTAVARAALAAITTEVITSAAHAFGIAALAAWPALRIVSLLPALSCLGLHLLARPALASSSTLVLVTTHSVLAAAHVEQAHGIVRLVPALSRVLHRPGDRQACHRCCYG